MLLVVSIVVFVVALAFAVWQEICFARNAAAHRRFRIRRMVRAARARERMRSAAATKRR